MIQEENVSDFNINEFCYFGAERMLAYLIDNNIIVLDDDRNLISSSGNSFDTQEFIDSFKKKVDEDIVDMPYLVDYMSQNLEGLFDLS